MEDATIRWTWPLLVLVLGCQGKRCGINLPPDSETDEPETGETGDTDSGQEQAPCAVPEEEPNGSAMTANRLNLEEQGCGVFSEALDLDHWTFDFPSEGWVGILVDARRLASNADPGVLVTSDSGVSAQVGELAYGEDIHLVFPTSADRYQLILAELQPDQGGEDHRYEVLATWAKAPVSWNLNEVEPNETLSGSQVLSPGDRVFGWLDSSLDSDWYQVTVPAGKQTLVLDLNAWEFGSAGDFKIAVYDEDEQSVGTWLVGELGYEYDPYVTLTSSGDETFYFRIAELRDRSSMAYWYVLNVSLLGEQ